jgi:diguanylate cyclase (GGDEF)-like protein
LARSSDRRASLSALDLSLRRSLEEAAAAFPRGGLLPEENWRHRHLALSLVLLWHFPVLLGFGLAKGYPIGHSLLEAALPVAFGLIALWSRLSRGWRSMSVATGLIGCSIVLVHLSHGLTEAHFHFFVVVGLLTLYQDWKPFLIAFGLTVLEHGVVGVLRPQSVYNHADAWVHPWKWALIHGGFIAAASLAGITSWSMSEADHRRRRIEAARTHAQREAVLVHAAHHDQLTGLPNRRMLVDHLDAAVTRSRESGTLLGLLFVDLDGFKPINDAHGHLVGDAVLTATADRLRAAVRGSDMAARLGGDEFVVVYESLQDSEALTTATARIERALTAPITVVDLNLTVSASIGHTLADADDDAEALIERADLDMYRVKRRRHGDLDLGARPSIPSPR